jgi:hypothetical protein
VTTQPAQTPRSVSPFGSMRLRRGAFVAAAVVVAVIVWLIVKDHGNDHKSSGQSAPPASAASIQQLRDTQASVGHPVYWAGRRTGFTYELTQVNANVYVRYLPPGTPLGDPRPSFLTVGTYSKPNAFASLKRLGNRNGNTSNKIDGGGVAVFSDSRPQSVYFAYPGSKVQVEVYDPSARRALRLVLSGRVKPVG